MSQRSKTQGLPPKMKGFQLDPGISKTAQRKFQHILGPPNIMVSKMILCQDHMHSNEQTLIIPSWGFQNWTNSLRLKKVKMMAGPVLQFTLGPIWILQKLSAGKLVYA